MSRLVQRARLQQRRLRAAARRGGWLGRQAAELSVDLHFYRGSEPNVINGPLPHLSMLSSWLNDYSRQIDRICQA